MAKYSELKALAEQFCGQVLESDEFVLYLNRALRSISQVAKIEQIDTFDNVSSDDDEDFATLSLSEGLIQIVSVVVNDNGYRTVIDGVGYLDFIDNPKDQLFALEDDKVLLKIFNKTYDSVRVHYYKPIAQVEYTGEDQQVANLLKETIPLKEDWNIDILAFSIAKSFFVNLEDEDNVNFYEIEFKRELKKLSSDVARRHSNNTVRRVKRKVLF